MKRIITIVLSIVGVVALVSVGLFFFLPKEKVESVVQNTEAFFLSGNVMIKKSDSDVWVDIERDVGLDDGDVIKTAGNSSVELKFGKNEKNVIAARDNTTVELEKITMSGDKTINLKNGQLLSLIDELDSDSKFEVKTPTAVCGVLGTGFETYSTDEFTTVKVYEGTVTVKPAGIRGVVSSGVAVQEGTMTRVPRSGAPQKPIPLPSEDIERWHEWKGDIDEHKFRTFYVFMDENSPLNHYVPSGWSGDYDSIRRVSSTKNPYSGNNCLRFRYTGRTSQGAGWAGVYWLNPVNNWGDIKGGFSLKGANRLSFYARGEKGGEVIVRFGMGGVGGQHPDTARAEIGPITLTEEWKRYEIDLAEMDLTYISGGFYWMTDKVSNPEGAIFYLDDIRYEE